MLVCGAYAFDDDDPHPLLAVLPPVMHAPASGARTTPIASVVELLSLEVGSLAPGAETASRRLIDVLFLCVLRDWLAGLPEGSAGRLGAMRDPTTQRAIAALHGAPSKEWTLPRLAPRAYRARPWCAASRLSWVSHRSPISGGGA